VKNTTKQLLLFVFIGILASCAASPERFYRERSSLSAETLCRTYDAAIKKSDLTLAGDASQELSTRLGISTNDCPALVSAQNAKIAAGIIAAAAITAVAIAASKKKHHGGGGYYPAAASNSTFDHEWDWDQFYGENGELMAACRGVQSGQFAEQWRCAGKAQSDWRWPGK